MDKDKLNEAAEEYMKTAPIEAVSPYYDEDMVEMFKGGVNWLLSQPLTDRLTDEEKERIKAKYNELKSLNSITNEMFADDTAILEWLFGKELFNEK